MPQIKKIAAKKATAKPTAARPAPNTGRKAAKVVSNVAKAVQKSGAKPIKSAKAKAAPATAAVKTKPALKATKATVKSVKATSKKSTVLPAAKKPAATSKPTASAKPPATKPAVAKPAAVKPPLAKPAVPAAVLPVAKNVPAAVAKPAAQRISSPPLAPKEPLVKALEAQRQQQIAATAAAKKPVSTRHGFKTNEFIVYPAHGVGRIVGIEEQEIAGMALELFVINFEKDKMTLRVPTGKLQSVGMRKLADETIVRRAMETLKGRARIKRTMWSRRAQEYEAKINSGDLISIAEVVRDLYRSETQPEQSYSERQLYEAALDRMAREIAAVDKIDERSAVQRITDVLSKSAKGRRAAEEDAASAEADEAGDDEVQAA